MTDDLASNGEAGVVQPASKHMPILLFILLIAVNYLAFSPSFVRVFSHENVSYIAELHGSTKLSDGLKLCDYNRVRQYMKGDEMLYRPLLFAWMAVENSLFGANHVYWNVANFLLHLAVVFLLWKLLDSIHQSYFSILFALCFSVLTAQVELVMWCHLGGYLWACIFILCGLYCARKCEMGETQNRAAWLLGYTVSLTLGVFFYELCFIVAILFGIYLGYRLWRTTTVSKAALIALLSAPIVIYLGFYIPHSLNSPQFWYRYGFQDNEGTLQHLFQLIIRCCAALVYLVKHALVPSAIIWEITPYYRFVTQEYRFGQIVLELVALAPLIAVSTLLFSRENLRRNKPLILLLLLSLAAYTLIICVGRKYMVSYYNYMFDLLAIIILYSLLDFSSPSRKLLSKAYAFLLTAFFCYNAFHCIRVSDICYATNFAPHKFITGVLDFVETHRNESNFSIKIENVPPEIDPIFPLRLGYPEAPVRIENKRMSEIFFQASINQSRPLYTLTWDPETLQVVPMRH